ncbi:MAG TPA: insulinase family protein [Clostridiales bacterium]|mgnify:CR=1 FL=1|nr:insulinase family protein [Clostridiales bacterium]
MKEIIRSQRLGEQYQKILHPSGLTILLYPMEGFKSAYALFATNYGSVDASFKTDKDEDFVTVPAGIAHFLEHKLFESEDGDAFERYAKTGANANAFTSFDKTAYLFSCTDHFKESIEILLDFVTHPYFTPQTVKKEQGIIGQEIRMYDDNPDWRVYFNLLGALYHVNPVRIDIAGTVESIAQIDADLLYRCYHTFYNLHNMTLAVAGNFDPDVVLDAADRILKPAPKQELTRKVADEPDTVRTTLVEQTLPVAIPLFQIGFKGKAGKTERENLWGKIADEVLLEIIAGDSTPLYRRLLEAELINQTFEGEAMANRDYSLTFYSGESRDPKRVRDEIATEILRLRSEGIDPQLFDRVKKAVYGRYLGAYGRPEALAGLMVTAQFADADAYEILEMLASLTLDQLNERLPVSFDVERCALSIVRS